MFSVNVFSVTYILNNKSRSIQSTTVCIGRKSTLKCFSWSIQTEYKKTKRKFMTEKLDTTGIQPGRQSLLAIRRLNVIICTLRREKSLLLKFVISTGPNSFCCSIFIPCSKFNITAIIIDLLNLSCFHAS